MSAHTPGPWDYDGEILYSGKFGVFGSDLHSTWKGYQHIATLPNSPNWEANARLMSAAPDLLAVARLILKEWEADTTGVQIGTLIARLSQYAPEARAAIAKAEGRES